MQKTSGMMPLQQLLPTDLGHFSIYRPAIITIIATVIYFDFPDGFEWFLVLYVIVILAIVIYMCINESFGVWVEN